MTLSQPAWEAVAQHCHGEPLGRIDIKGKGLLEMVRVDRLSQKRAMAASIRLPAAIGGVRRFICPRRTGGVAGVYFFSGRIFGTSLAMASMSLSFSSPFLKA